MDEFAQLVALAETLRIEVQRLGGLLSEVEAENHTLRTRVAERDAEILNLKERLGLDSNNSSKPPSTNPPWVKPPSKKTPSGKKPGGQPGHTGKARTHAASESVDHTVAVRPTACKGCGGALGETAKSRPGWVHQVVEIPPIQAVITNFEMASCQCAACGEWTKAQLPSGVPVGVAGPNLQALVAYTTGRMRVSRRYLHEFLGAVGVYLSLGTIQSILTLDPRQRTRWRGEGTSEALAAPAAEAMAVVQRSASLHCDETGFGRSKDKR